jgi:molybdopterin-binding protein
VEAGVRNQFAGTIKEIKSDGIMALVRMTMDGGGQNLPLVSSVMTRESLEDAGFKEGDHVKALIKAINVVFIKH